MLRLPALLRGQHVSIVEVLMNLVGWWMQLVAVAVNNMFDYHYW